MNTKAFTKDLEPEVQHDCIKPFDEEYHDRSDLANMCALAYAIPEAGFYRLIENVLQLLGPGGYIQWSERESQLWKAISVSAEEPSEEGRKDLTIVERSLEIVDEERSARGLFPYPPHFMVRSLMHLPLLQNVSAITKDSDPMSIIYFELKPGDTSITSEGLDSQRVDAFSKLILEALKHLLTAALIRKKETMERPSS